jgi:hypothetical protein
MPNVLWTGTTSSFGSATARSRRLIASPNKAATNLIQRECHAQEYTAAILSEVQQANALHAGKNGRP